MHSKAASSAMEAKRVLRQEPAYLGKEDKLLEATSFSDIMDSKPTTRSSTELTSGNSGLVE
jgi:hypothetical protein